MNADSIGTRPDQPSEDSLRFARDSVAREFDYRRNHLWRIFSWAANLIIAVIGAVTALSAQDTFLLTTTHRGLLTLTIAIIATHAGAWIKMQSRFKRNVEEVLENYDKQLLIMHQPSGATKPYESEIIGYIFTLVLLSLAATLTIWIVPE